MDLMPGGTRTLRIAFASFNLLIGAAWLIRAGLIPAALGAAVVHLLLASHLLYTTGQAGTRPAPRGWHLGLLTPWLLWLLAWSELGWLNQAAPPRYFDTEILRLDAAVFGVHLNLVLPQLCAGPIWREAMSAIYLSYYFLILGPPLWLLVTRRQPAFWRSTSLIVTTYLAAFALYLLIPVRGPQEAAIASGLVPGRDLTGLLPRVMALLVHHGDSIGTAFPSSHCAGACAAALAASRYATRRAALGFGLWAGLIVFSTLQTNNHYALDALAGVLLAGLVHLTILGLRRFAGQTKESRHEKDPHHRSDRIHRTPPGAAAAARRLRTAGPGQNSGQTGPAAP